MALSHHDATLTAETSNTTSADAIVQAAISYSHAGLGAAAHGSGPVGGAAEFGIAAVRKRRVSCVRARRTPGRLEAGPGSSWRSGLDAENLAGAGWGAEAVVGDVERPVGTDRHAGREVQA